MTATKNPTPESVYTDLWGPIIEKSEDPELTTKQLLYDYGSLLSDTSILFTYLTEGEITDPQVPFRDVINVADKVAADAIDGGIRAVLDVILERIQSVSSEPAETQLSVLIDSINSIYESGLELAPTE